MRLAAWLIIEYASVEEYAQILICAPIISFNIFFSIWHGMQSSATSFVTQRTLFLSFSLSHTFCTERSSVPWLSRFKEVFKTKYQTWNLDFLILLYLFIFPNLSNIPRQNKEILNISFFLNGVYKKVTHLLTSLFPLYLKMLQDFRIMFDAIILCDVI